MKSLNVVILSLNSQYIHSSLAPYCLLAAAQKSCAENIKVQVVEGSINDSLQNITDKIITLSPDVIGFSCYIWNISAVKKLIPAVKSALPGVKIILGGPEVSYNAKDVLAEHTQVDFIISGEGEVPFPALLNSIASENFAFDIPGVCRRQNGEIILSSPFTDTGEPPSPFIPEYFNALSGRIAYIESSRGCPYSCAFCLSGRCSKVRFFDIERTKSEMILLAKSGTQTIKFVDRTFNANKKRTLEIFKFIADNRDIFANVCFHFEIAGDILTEQIIDLLKLLPPGSVQFEIGLQSFNKKSLEKINRKTNIEKLKDNIKKVLALGNIHTHIDLIAGLPFEDMESIKESFDTAFSLSPHVLQFGFLKILHGSPMAENKNEFPCTHSPLPPYEVTETPWLSENELSQLHHFEAALDKMYNSGRFKRTIEYLLNFYSPFKLFWALGQERLPSSMPLDEYTCLVFEFFSRDSRIDKGVLRDKMVCDRLATNSTGTLAPALKVFDKNLKSYKKAVPKKEGVKTGFAYLYSENKIVYAHYDKKNPVTGEYRLYKAKGM